MPATGTSELDHSGVRPGLSIVVPTRDRSEMLARCLQSLAAAMAPSDELIVVDSSSRNPVELERATVALGAKVLRSDLPGASLARNLGWRAAAHDLVAFVDDDVWVAEGWADALVRRLSAGDGVTLVTGRIEAPAGQVSHFVAVKDDPDAAIFDRSSRGMIGHSASMAIRREALENLGGFDTSMGPGSRFRAAEDGDLFDRFLVNGGLCAYEPSAAAWHDQWREPGRLVRLNLDYGIGAGGRLAKLLRTDRSRLRVVAGEYWSWFATDAWKGVRQRNKVLLASALARSVGMAIGCVIGLAMRIEAGHFRAGRPEGRPS